MKKITKRNRKSTRSVTLSLAREKELKLHKKVTRHFDVSKEKNELKDSINQYLQYISSRVLVLNIVKELMNDTNASEESFKEYNSLILEYTNTIEVMKTSMDICNKLDSVNSDPLDAFEGITLLSSTTLESFLKANELETRYKELIAPYSNNIQSKLQELINDSTKANEARQEVLDVLNITSDDDNTDESIVVETEDGERENSEETENSSGDEVSRAD